MEKRKVCVHGLNDPPSIHSDVVIPWLSLSEAPRVCHQRNIRFSEREN